MAEGRDHAGRSSPATAWRWSTRRKALSRRAPLGAGSADRGQHHLPRRARRCRPNSTAAPTTTSTPSASWLPVAARRRAWSMRSMPFANASPSRPRRPSVFAAARAPGPAGEAACRAAQRPAAAPRSRPLRRAQLRPPGMSPEGAGMRHGARPAPWRCCCPAPSTSCARRNCRRVPGAARAPACRSRMATDYNPGSSPALSLLLMLNMACTLLPADARRGAGAASRRTRRASVWPIAGRLAAGQRADFVRVGRRRTRAS